VSSAIDTVPWSTVGTVDLDALAKAKMEAINLVQWLARLSNSYVTKSPPERRTELEFRAADAAFFTRPFAKNLALKIELPSLQMQFLDGGNPVPHIFDPEEHSPAEIEAWILVELLHHGLDREKFSKKLPYKIPRLMSGDAEDHSPQACREGLTQLMAWFKNAAAILGAASRGMGAAKMRIVCLPQTLGLACISETETGHRDFGFSPGDPQNPQPFFYISSGSAAKNRSVLTASKLLADSDPAATVLTFLKP
jgi:hypothetical protein